MKNDNLYSVKEFAEKMQVNNSTAHRWLHSGIVPDAELVRSHPCQLWKLTKRSFAMKRPVRGLRKGQKIKRKKAEPQTEAVNK